MKGLFDRLFSGGFSGGYFLAPLQNFTWRDVLDILLLAALFFAVFRYVCDRRAGKLLWGVGLLVGAYAVSEILNMYALRYIFGSFFGHRV